MLNTNLLKEGTKVKNIHVPNIVLTYSNSIQIANQPVFIFIDKDDKEVRLNKPSLCDNYVIL